MALRVSKNLSLESTMAESVTVYDVVPLDGSAFFASSLKYAEQLKCAIEHVNVELVISEENPIRVLFSYNPAEIIPRLVTPNPKPYPPVPDRPWNCSVRY